MTDRLAGRLIGLGVTGSIAAPQAADPVEAVDDLPEGMPEPATVGEDQ